MTIKTLRPLYLISLALCTMGAGRGFVGGPKWPDDVSIDQIVMKITPFQGTVSSCDAVTFEVSVTNTASERIPYGVLYETAVVTDNNGRQLTPTGPVPAQFVLATDGHLDPDETFSFSQNMKVMNNFSESECLSGRYTAKLTFALAHNTDALISNAMSFEVK